MIVIKPIGGMCNRMRSIDSAVSLAKKIGKKVHVIWESNSELNCRFDRLFEPSDHFTLKETGYFPDLHPFRIWSKFIFKVQGAKLLGRFRFDKIFYEQDLKILTAEGFDAGSLQRYNKILIYSCNKFYPGFSLQHNFKPIGLMKEKIDKAAEGITANTVGIHVRRTDNIRAIQKSPLELFIEKMNSEIAGNPETTFFVASDSKETETILREQFPGRILSYSKEINRDSENGMQDALIDLFCLSRTKKLYGSFWSSFSHTAAGLSGIEEITVTNPGSY